MVLQLTTRMGYQDDFFVIGDLYHYWAIEAPPWVAQELPLDRAGFNVQWVSDLAPIRLRKVAILNGAHTLLASCRPAGGPSHGTLWEEITTVLPFS